MTQKERAVMQQALEALDRWKEWDAWHKHNAWEGIDEQAITALREALAEQACPNGCDTSNGRCVDCPDYVAEQAEQEPVCCDKCGSKLGTTVVPCDCIAPMQQAEQEPVAIDWEHLQNFWRNNSSIDWGELESAVKCAVAAPVRTKDLTPHEITALIREGAADGGWQGFAQRVQNAFKEKNRG